MKRLRLHFWKHPKQKSTYSLLKEELKEKLKQEILQKTKDGFNGIWISPDTKKQLKVELKKEILTEKEKQIYEEKFEKVNYENYDC